MYNRLSSNREGSNCDGLKKVYTGGHVCLSEVPEVGFFDCGCPGSERDVLFVHATATLVLEVATQSLLPQVP